MQDELFDLVQRAQNGDKDAMMTIIEMFTPVIKSQKNKTKRDRQEDLEQSIYETLIKKIKSYDLTNTPDFTSFCNLLKNK